MEDRSPAPDAGHAIRYYVVLPHHTDTGFPYVLAETCRETSDDGSFRASSMAASVAGATALVLTEAELQAEAGGPAALVAWHAGDDRSFDEETDRFAEASAEVAPLRLVVGGLADEPTEDAAR